jgi:hypothetical protein
MPTRDGVVFVPNSPRRRGVATAALMLSLAGPPASAQTPANPQLQPPPKTFGQVRIGPVFFTPRVGLENVGIETNAPESGTVDQGTSGGGQLALTFSAFLGERIVLVGRKLRVSADVGVDYVYNSHLTASAESLSFSFQGARAEYFASPRLTLFGNGNYRYTKDRPSFEIDAPVRRLNAGFSAGAQFSPTARIRSSLQAQWSLIRYDGATYQGVDLANSLNETRVDLTATLSYGLTRWTELFMPVTWRLDRFEFETGRNGETRSLGGGARFSPRGFLSGSIEAGRTRLQPTDPGAEGYSGLYYRGVATLTFRDTTAIEFSSQQNFNYSYDVNRAFYVYRWSGVFVRQRLGQRFDVGPFHNWYNSQYSGSSTPAGTTRVWGVDVGYVHRQSRYDVYLSYWRPGANIEGGAGYHGWRFGFRIQTRRISFSERGIFLNGPMGIGVIQP